MVGKMYVFEGLDGAGKSTVIKLVKKELIKKGVRSSKIFVTAEPTQSSIGKKIRELLSSSKDPFFDGEFFLSLYVLDRKHHLKKDVLPALHAGKLVLCDRFKYSTLVYQSIQGINPKDIVKLHKEMIAPDIVFVLDLPVDSALERLSRSRASKDVFEKKDFMQKARKKFLSLNKFFPNEKIIVIDASKPLTDVVKKISGIIYKTV